jgi:hypothetical protein
MGGPQSPSGVGGEEKNFQPLPGTVGRGVGRKYWMNNGVTFNSTVLVIRGSQTMNQVKILKNTLKSAVCLIFGSGIFFTPGEIVIRP